MVALEEKLANALIATVGGTRPSLTVEQIKLFLLDHFNANEEVEIRRFGPLDFLLEFDSHALAERVLHARPLEPAPFRLIFQRWTCQFMPTAALLLFKVLVAIENLPAHAWSNSAAQTIHGNSCALIQLAPETVARVDKSRFWVAAWCEDPDLIPKEKVVVIPEPDAPHDPCGHLFLHPEEIIHTRKDTLRYHVVIHLVESHNYNPRSDSDDDLLGWLGPDNGDDSDDSDDDYPGFDDASGSGKPWPKKHRFNCAMGHGDGDGLALHGNRGGAPFQSRRISLWRSVAWPRKVVIAGRTPEQATTRSEEFKQAKTNHACRNRTLETPPQASAVSRKAKADSFAERELQLVGPPPPPSQDLPKEGNDNIPGSRSLAPYPDSKLSSLPPA